MLQQLAEDDGLFAGMAGKPSADSYPMKQSLHTSMLATSIGVTMGLDEATLRQLNAGSSSMTWAC